MINENLCGVSVKPAAKTSVILSNHEYSIAFTDTPASYTSSSCSRAIMWSSDICVTEILSFNKYYPTARSKVAMQSDNFAIKTKLFILTAPALDRSQEKDWKSCIR